MIILDLSLAEQAIEEYIINKLTNKQDNKMGERYESNPAEVVAGFQVFPDGDYVVEIQEPKGSQYNTKDGKKAGIRFNLKIADGEFKHKVMSYFGDELNEFGKAANKRLLMASQGLEITDENEKKFNTEIVPNYGWGFNSDGVVDNGWLLAKGKVVTVNVGTNISTDGSGKQFQKFNSFRPYPGPAPAPAEA